LNYCCNLNEKKWCLKLKRIVSLDFFRGLAILCMLGFHVLIHVSYHAQTSNYSDLNEIIDSGLLPLFLLIFLLANFRALFLLGSMTIHGYIMVKAIKKGASAGSLLKKNLFFAFMLYIVALFCESIAANWGVLGRSIQNLAWSPDEITHIMHFETLNSIAVSIAFLSLVLYFMSRRNGIVKVKRNIIIFLVLAVVFIFSSYIISKMVHIYWPEYYSLEEQYTWSSVGEFFVKLGLAAIMGVEQPIFPFMATTCIGGIVGILIAQDQVSLSLPKKGMLIGLLLIIGGIIVLVLDLTEFTVEFDVFPTWFFILTTGLELIFMMAILRMVEFSPRVAKSEKMQRFIKKSTFVRGWGMISLSIFVWQVYPEFLMRWLGNVVTGGQVEFFIRGKADPLSSIIMIFIVIIVWNLIIRLWEKGKFKGSFEWLMSLIGAKVLGRGKLEKPESQAIKPGERMNIQEVLYHPEPIIFV